MDSECVNCDDQARENVELRARLAEVEAERDPVGAWLRMKARAEAAEARLAAVEAKCEKALTTPGYNAHLPTFARRVRAAAAGDDRAAPHDFRSCEYCGGLDGAHRPTCRRAAGDDQ